MRIFIQYSGSQSDIVSKIEQEQNNNIYNNNATISHIPIQTDQLKLYLNELNQNAEYVPAPQAPRSQGTPLRTPTSVFQEYDSILKLQNNIMKMLEENRISEMLDYLSFYQSDISQIITPKMLIEIFKKSPETAYKVVLLGVNLEILNTEARQNEYLSFKKYINQREEIRKSQTEKFKEELKLREQTEIERNKKLIEEQKTQVNTECTICRDAQVNASISCCGMKVHKECIEKLKKCPWCNKPYTIQSLEQGTQSALGGGILHYINKYYNKFNNF